MESIGRKVDKEGSRSELKGVTDENRKTEGSREGVMEGSWIREIHVQRSEEESTR